MDGLRLATTLDLPVRVGMTATAPEAELLRALLAGMGITGKDFAGDARSWPGGPPPRASVIEDTNTCPRSRSPPTGVHWHPAGADLDTSPDMLLARYPTPYSWVPLAEAKRLAVERSLVLRRSDGSLPLL